MPASVLGACVLRFLSLFFSYSPPPSLRPPFSKKAPNVWHCADYIKHNISVCAWICVCTVVLWCVCVCVFVWAAEVLPLRRQSLQGPRSFVASHPLPLHLTNYCATSTPLMRPGTCPSVLLWARLVSLYWYRKKTPSHPALWRDFFFYFLFFFFSRSDAVN